VANISLSGHIRAPHRYGTLKSVRWSGISVVILAELAPLPGMIRSLVPVVEISLSCKGICARSRTHSVNIRGIRMKCAA